MYSFVTQAEDGQRDFYLSRRLGDVNNRQVCERMRSYMDLYAKVCDRIWTCMQTYSIVYGPVSERMRS